MTNKIVIAFILLSISFAKAQTNKWINKETGQYSLHYTIIDKKVVNELEGYLMAGFRSVGKFFDRPFKNKIDIYIFPDRMSLDEQWKVMFKDTSFRSQCWMVASGTNTRLDLISPSVWEKEACDHNANDKKEIQDIITHELVHVLHSQYNPSPDFEGMDPLAWFVEGLATWASGQLNEKRLAEVKKIMNEGKHPVKLENVWSGKAKYGLAGSLVKFIDVTYGRKTVIELLSYNDQQKILARLKLSEPELISNWKNYFISN